MWKMRAERAWAAGVLDWPREAGVWLAAQVKG
jgi:hypothetical protein